MKLGHISILLFVLLFTLLFTHSAMASGLRCNSKVIKTGDSQYKFFRLCGEPAYVDKKVVYLSSSVSSKRSGEPRYHSHDEQQASHQKTYRKQHNARAQGYTTTQYRHGNSAAEIRHEREEEVLIEHWTYDFGPNRLVQKIRFVDGVATTISNQGYGYARN
ncbi:MAG: DUF2845 domain-containing protein [Psychrosphaera sp.]|nr:DUF2845 domain-containing protein [Psychrosphaera sp.]